MSSVRLQNKNLFLTYNDPEETITGPAWLLNKLAEQLEKYQPYYGVCGEEKAPTTGTKHYHLLIMCKNPVISKNGQVIEIKGIAPHIEKIRNNLRGVIKYVKKDGNIAELNKNLCPVKLDKLERKEKADLMLTGDLEKAFIDGTLGPIEVIRAEKLRKIFQVYRKPEPYSKKLIMWYRGETGEGKTRTAVELAEEFELSYWITNESLRWFDGYNGQELVIIDDFRQKMITDWNFLLRLLDGYGLSVPVKGGYVAWKPKIIIITTPATPQEAFQWMNKDGELQNWDHLDQLMRRLTHDDEEQVYQFPLWEEDKQKLMNTVRQFLGIENDEAMVEEELSMSPILPEPTQIDEA
ncbi:rep protein [Porcine stool-associated circular virus 5]|uniref:rep protein n=1 Tax=Porcine stool-associated circular virus 5 TaxID=1475063 RepID=UPI00042E3CEA|nr:rep protein [Porcine stool-associated circular virus 5]AHM24972.1 rep protein [Porcine stool-associated circular virus 5]